MVLEGSSEALYPPPSLELRPSCNKSQPSPPLGSGSQPHDSFYQGDKEQVKYGELIVLGYNGSLANGDKGRRRSRLALYKRPKANGVKPDIIHNISTPLVSKALSNKSQHSISYTLSRSHSVIVEYTHDPTTDMFQIGRSTESMIDFVVTDTTPSGQGAAGEGGQSAQSTISRYACRIICERSPPYTTRIYAAGFDSSNNIFLGGCQVEDVGRLDGRTDHERGAGHACGNVYALRETRSAQQRGKLVSEERWRGRGTTSYRVENESNTLQDGSLIDLCGATLLWRTPAGLRRTPTLKQLESLRQELNAARPQCPVGFNTLAFPSLAQREIVDKKQPWVYMNCGHVHGYHNWGFRKEKGGGAGGGGGSLAATSERECPMCRRVGPYVPLWLGCEGGLYLDAGPPTHAFCPCGHVCSEKTVQGWSQIPLPHGTHAFHAACPFCGTWLTGEQGYVKLIFQGPLD
ncbi:E3 ubiquitin-protein ligase pellino 1-like [Scleropages formosus]|uniref:E3 ubiquitin-protein ligase pellino 1-like n=1 Tax=Scleropages formosus TaxID=113540 RepID=A0A0P7Z9L8_SCLFO|nr:E3 ubiquitin-protein ligase pellino 1-like [Scleropages formosus]